MTDTRHSEGFGRVRGGALTVAEVAAALGVGEQSVRRRINDGTIAHFRVGSAMRVPVEELDRIRRGEKVPA
jgi:excisionase family DNA binding protein